MRMITVVAIWVLAGTFTLGWLISWYVAAFNGWEYVGKFNAFHEQWVEGVMFHLMAGMLVYWLIKLGDMVERGYGMWDRVFRSGRPDVVGDADDDEAKEV